MGLTIGLPGWNVSVRLKHSGVKNFITWALKFCLKVVRLPLKSGGGPEDPHAWPGWRAWVRKRGRAGEKDFCDIHARQITRHPREYVVLRGRDLLDGGHEDLGDRGSPNSREWQVVAIGRLDR